MSDRFENDEMLNSYLDGELDPRQMTEVKRLLANSKEMTSRLRELERLKVMVGSVPSAEIPEGLAGDIKAQLERRALLFDGGDIESGGESESGTKVLIWRKVVSAAAMIALAAVLVGVVVSIIIPESSLEKVRHFGFSGETKQAQEVAAGQQQKEQVSGVQKSKGLLFRGRLELLTADIGEYEKVFGQLIKDAGLEENVSSHFKEKEGSYYLNCSMERLGLLLAGLDKQWDKVVRSRFAVEDVAGVDVVTVEGVSAAQVSDIYGQDGEVRRMEAARYYSALNEIHQLSPGGSEGESELPMESRPMPRPVLTSGEKRGERAKDEPQEQIRLTIVVKESE